MGNRVLIADDEPYIRLALRVCLEAEHYEVEEAVDGKDALQHVLSNPPDVLLLDLCMPGYSAFEVLQHLEAAGVRIPTAILTAQSVTKGLQIAITGSACLVEKPITLLELRSLVERLMDQRRGTEQNVHSKDSSRLSAAS